jgi:hypothetical protein
MNSTATAALLLALAVLLAGGCTDEPNASGSRLLPDSLEMVTATTVSTSDTSYLLRIGGNQAALLVGASAGFEAYAVVRFSFPAFDTTSAIDSAFITVRPEYFLPDSGGPASFTVHRMTSTWASSTFRWDSVAGSYDTAASGSFAGTVGSADTALRVRVDTSLARAWLTASSGSMMVAPSAGGTTVVGFHSHLAATGLKPTLDVYYRAAADTTVRMTRLATDAVFVADGVIPVQAGLTVLQAGVAWRAHIRFDSLRLPAGASIAEAWLELTPNPGLPPVPGAQRDTVTMSFVQDREFPLDSLVLSGFCNPVTEGGTRIYRADVRSYVQLWSSAEPNLGIVVRGLGEYTTLDQIGLYNTAAADSLRPRIRITYTQFP